MYCPQCGHPNIPDAVFCAQCGTSLPQPATPPSPPQPVATGKKGTSTWLIVVIVIVALLAILCCCCVIAGGGLALISGPGLVIEPTHTPVYALPPKPTKAPGPTPIQPVPLTPVQPVRFKVGLVTDIGGVDDKGFNAAAWNALLQAEKDLDAEVSYIEVTNFRDYEENINTLADKGYNVVVTSGFALGEATAKAAKRYPNIKLIGTDQFQVETIPNYAGLIFDEDKAGFLAGALAALMSKSETVGAVLGMDVVPPVVKFSEGYAAGARYINPDIKVILTYHPGDLGKAFADPEWGKQTARQQIDQGADVIFAAAGLTGHGALIAAAEEKVYCIGVDMDQYYTVPEARPYILSSAMKLITPGTFDLIEAVQKGTFQGGNVVGDVGLAPFHDTEDQVPAEVKAKLQEIEKGLNDGSIQTGVRL